MSLHYLDELGLKRVIDTIKNHLDSQFDSTGCIEEAPEDGKAYARKDADWVEVEAVGGLTELQVSAFIDDFIGDVSDLETKLEAEGFLES